MSTTAHNGQADKGMDLDPAQQWVLHHLMVDRVNKARKVSERPPWWAVRIIGKLERGDLSFSTFEAWRIRHDLRAYLNDAPERDAEAAESILATLEGAFESPPPSLQD